MPSASFQSLRYAKIRARWSYRSNCWKVSRNLFLFTCSKCRSPMVATNNSPTSAAVCGDCRGEPTCLKRRRFITPAHSEVHKAVRTGRLLPASSWSCVDCGKDATCYDHRDYSKPLQVEPVCWRCNAKRGPAIQLDHITDKRFVVRN